MRVVLHLHNFGVPRIAVANITVAGVIDISAGITRFYRFHSLDLIKYCFQAPETPTGQRRSH